MNSSGNQKASLWAVGLMLFALFFGAGNLIFPAFLGQQAGENWFSAMLGFLLTGAGLPLLGVIAIGYSNSRDVQVLASRVTPLYGILFASALYLAIGPLFATPRTATVSFEIGVVPYISEENKTLALALFSLFFFGVAYWLSLSPGKLVGRIGKILTPALLVTIAILMGYAAMNPMGALTAPQGDFAIRPFAKGILEGYGTMDALASLVFAIIVIDAVRAMGVDNRAELLRTTTVAGVVAAACLALVYLMIGYMGATSVAGLGMQENGAAVLSKTAQFYFGNAGNILLSVIVFLACLSTAIGLIVANAEFFNRLCPGISYKTFVTIFTLVSMGFANKGLAGIISFSIPVLMLLYPLTVVIILLAFLHNLFGGGRIVYICTIFFTLIVGVLDAYKAAFGFSDETAAAINNALPLYDIGLGWVVPAVVGFILGCILNAVFKKKA
ncbi:branched-chain amino acid transport system II carrier protein [Neisseria sp. N95_16]|uniref:Branched-chain amino acid transport system carrier protein n=1 Tax=Neisseria brasiliensis TaxID=2666100 RepID=A0A5Q3S2I0_9NEIS|nr:MULTISPECIES: branched-chain amino acid transport system II carrier protein [Neisseria]MRN39142.1 branched-chain amino acid transport system II carrier protein [Neisseria brasiliensis]PJO10239.1 branched-chain amino acid transport system II carrier protein [Neisseria sp. N95_16]PJO77940.1 branched-chain amino acid transport system II carrier protein [Neisseria sp. N177_16]QGL26155.1 branched-chain amino acid transport system II carrier protein [Neisseria brasiliensis]